MEQNSRDFLTLGIPFPGILFGNSVQSLFPPHSRVFPAAFLPVLRRLPPAEQSQGFPSLRKGHLEYFPGQERGEGRDPPSLRNSRDSVRICRDFGLDLALEKGEFLGIFGEEGPGRENGDPGGQNPFGMREFHGILGRRVLEGIKGIQELRIPLE